MMRAREQSRVNHTAGPKSGMGGSMIVVWALAAYGLITLLDQLIAGVMNEWARRLLRKENHGQR